MDEWWIFSQVKEAHSGCEEGAEEGAVERLDQCPGYKRTSSVIRSEYEEEDRRLTLSAAQPQTRNTIRQRETRTETTERVTQLVNERGSYKTGKPIRRRFEDESPRFELPPFERSKNCQLQSTWQRKTTNSPSQPWQQGRRGCHPSKGSHQGTPGE